MTILLNIVLDEKNLPEGSHVILGKRRVCDTIKLFHEGSFLYQKSNKRKNYFYGKFKCF